VFNEGSTFTYYKSGTIPFLTNAIILIRSKSRQEDMKMKQLLKIVITGLALLLLLSMFQSNVINEKNLMNENREYSTIVPAKPPKPLEKLN
jgi:hypothetical protein